VARSGRRRRQHHLDARVRCPDEALQTGRAYLNFIGEEGEDRVRAAFGPEIYAWLQALKDRYARPTYFASTKTSSPPVR
jgi:hypothetical protein